MKNIKALIFIFIAMSVAVVSLSQEKTAAEVKKMVESQNYIFKAETMIPQSGSSKMLSSEYDLTVTTNKIISYLPYFGRAYVPIMPGEGGIKFTSTDFEYKKSKDGQEWEILIRPNDADGVRQLHLSIFENGKATLSVVNTNRQGISYHGYVTEGTIKEKKAF